MTSVFDTNYEYFFSVFVLGDECVGKSSLIQMYMEGSSQDPEKCPPTIGIDFHLKYVRKNGHQILLQLWDSSGQMKYREVIKHFIARVMGVILVLDVTSTDSLSQIGRWIEVIREHANHETQVRELTNLCSLRTKRFGHIGISDE